MEGENDLWNAIHTVQESIDNLSKNIRSCEINIDQMRIDQMRFDLDYNIRVLENRIDDLERKTVY